MILIYIVLEKKEKDIMDIKEKALIIIPELEERFEIDMSIESFEKNDLPKYYFIDVLKEDKVKYTFETNYGSAEIVVDNFLTSQEEFTWNNVLQLHIDNMSSID